MTRLRGARVPPDVREDIALLNSILVYVATDRLLVGRVVPKLVRLPAHDAARPVSSENTHRSPKDTLNMLVHPCARQRIPFAAVLELRRSVEGFGNGKHVRYGLAESK